MAHRSSSVVEVRTDWGCAAPPDSETVFLSTTECGLRHTLCFFSRRKQNHRALSGGLIAKLCPGQDQKYLEEAEFLSYPEPAYLSRGPQERSLASEAAVSKSSETVNVELISRPVRRCFGNPGNLPEAEKPQSYCLLSALLYVSGPHGLQTQFNPI